MSIITNFFEIGSHCVVLIDLVLIQDSPSLLPGGWDNRKSIPYLPSFFLGSKQGLIIAWRDKHWVISSAHRSHSLDMPWRCYRGNSHVFTFFLRQGLTYSSLIWNSQISSYPYLPSIARFLILTYSWNRIDLCREKWTCMHRSINLYTNWKCLWNKHQVEILLTP